MAKNKKTTPTTTGQYDKIFKENASEIYATLIKAVLHIDTSHAQNLPLSDLQNTIERKADFLKKITPPNNAPAYALHIEIQSDNDEEMHKRMLLYYALILKTYAMNTTQFVIYIGNDNLSMTANIAHPKLQYGYEIIDIKRYDYEEFLQANTPEEVILAILGNFHGENASSIIEKILLRLQQLAHTKLALGKYATQLEIISKLRKLEKETKTQVSSMPIVFDITDTTAYTLGEAKGEAKGKAEAVYAMFAEGFAVELISRIISLPLPTIKTMYDTWKKSH